MNNITRFTPTDLISLHHGQPMTTSLQVAEVFGKLLKDILRKLSHLDCSQEFTERNFALSEYTDKNGRKLAVWNMTKNGFIFLVMGFTGKLAAQFKERYISAFDWMAEQLHTARPSHGITLPGANGPDGTFCGRMVVSIEYNQITHCRPLPFDAFIATPDNLLDRLPEPGRFNGDQLHALAEFGLRGLSQRARVTAQTLSIMKA